MLTLEREILACLRFKAIEAMTLSEVLSDVYRETRRANRLVTTVAKMVEPANVQH